MTWQLLSYNNGKEAVVSVLNGTEITAIFGEDGGLSGFAGCNNYSSAYEVDGDAITIGPAAATRKFCAEPEGTMEQEAAYLAALETAASFRIEGDSLELRAEDGALVADYIAQAEPTSNGASASDAAAVAFGNMEYQSEFTQSGKAPLVNGEYTEAAAPGSESEIVVQLTEYVAVGVLNDQPAAAVILTTNAGGSGVFYELAVVTEQDGQMTNVAIASLGDRVIINSVAIEDNKIIVDMVTQDDDDPMCCPTQQVINTYELQGNELVEISSEAASAAEAETVEAATVVTPTVAAPAAEVITPTVAPAPGDDLTGVVWQWQESQMSDDSTISVTFPAKYTMEFLPDGTVTLLADCNTGGGTYAVDGSSLSLAVAARTRRTCAPTSKTNLFLEQLNAAASYLIDDDGNLVINMKVDAGNMILAPAP